MLANWPTATRSATGSTARRRPGGATGSGDRSRTSCGCRFAAAPIASPAEPVEWWTGSDAHLDNLLQHDLSHSGVGVWLYHGDAYAVHDLAREKKGSAGVLGWITA